MCPSRGGWSVKLGIMGNSHCNTSQGWARGQPQRFSSDPKNNMQNLVLCGTGWTLGQDAATHLLDRATQTLLLRT